MYVVMTMRSDFIGDCMEYPASPRRSMKVSTWCRG